MSLITALLSVLLCGYLIMRICDVFEPAADYLGRNMSKGIKGATLNAVASSLPEMLTTFMMLFFYDDKDGFAAGLATCAGSSVFNIAIIPACCVLAVRWSTRRVDNAVTIRRRTVLVRDGLMFVLAMVVLLVVLHGAEEITWVDGISLVSVYVVYMMWLLFDHRKSNPTETEVPDEGEVMNESTRSGWSALLLLDFHALFVAGRRFTPMLAWTSLMGALMGLGVVCYGLTVAVMAAADGLGIAPYFAALILAAAATSVPDTILSVKDALKGNDDDAISNALASNTFNLTTCIGLPLLAYGLIRNQSLSVSTGTDGVGVYELCLLMLGICTLVLVTLRSKPLRLPHAVVLIGLYGLFIAGVVTGEMGLWSWS
jgi:cation:H+ antiporter